MNIDTNPTGSVEHMQDMAVKVGNPLIYNIPTPAATTASGTVTADQVLGGVITVKGATVTVTLPAAADLANGFRKYSRRGVIVGDSCELLLLNYSATMTIATTTGASIDTGSPTTIGTNAQGIAVLRFTNGTPGSEAYTIYL